jgi:hypothetical protein
VTLREKLIDTMVDAVMKANGFYVLHQDTPDVSDDTIERFEDAEISFRQDCVTALSAFRQWLEDEGLVVVPREATFGMYGATSKHCEDVLKAGEPPNPFRVWSLMIAAAPDALDTKGEG